jgi:predicted O-methyltransferase YrrM
MAFGLTGAPATFQSVMNKTLAPVLRKCALVFFDDILVYSASYEQHLHHVRQVLSLLSEQQWRAQAVQVFLCAAAN